MSQHILQHLDEQLLADIEHLDVRQDRDLLWKSTAVEPEMASRQWLSLRPPRQWLITAVALIIAALALLIAHDAGRRADELQRRLAMHERTISR